MLKDEYCETNIEVEHVISQQEKSNVLDSRVTRWSALEVQHPGKIKPSKSSSAWLEVTFKDGKVLYPPVN